MLLVYRSVPDSQVLTYFANPQQNKNQHTFNNGSELSSNKSSLSSSSLSYTSSRSASSVNNNNQNYTENEIERIKNCGSLFERNTVSKRLISNEFFRKEPCLYNQIVYKNSARIFNCLKADLNENPILKSLKQQRAKEAGDSFMEPNITEVPKITYDSNQEKRNTLQLAFSTLKFQKVLEDLIEEVQFYGKNPDLKDEQSLVCTILFDYMTRKFQLRDRLSDEPFDNHDQLITQIETTIYSNKTDLAAELAKNRIKADALTLDDLLPTDVKEVEHHKAELPLYCWINTLKINVQDLLRYLVEVEDLKIVDSKKSLERKCFMIDPHCNNVLMFHYALRNRILNNELVKTYKLIVQDKSSCLAPHTVLKLLSKKDDIIITNLSGGLLAAFIGCMMEELDGRVFVYGATNEDKYQEISNKLQLIGCAKYVKLIRDEFQNAKLDDSRLENVKVILVNAPCSKSALMNPMEFLFEEGEDVKHLRDYTLDVNKPSKIRKCIQEEYALMKHALRFPRVRAVIYQTYSKNSSENEQIVHRSVEEFNEFRKFPIFPYKITPPVIPLTAEDIQNDEVVKDYKFLQFKPSTKMNGCFIALLTRDRDAKIDFIHRKTEQLEKKEKKHSAPEPATFQEKNFLELPKKSAPELGSKLATSSIRSKSHHSTKKNSIKNKSSSKKSTPGLIANLDEELNRLQMNEKITITELIRNNNNNNNNKTSTNTPANTNIDSGVQSSLLFNEDRRRSSFDKLSQIGKLDPLKFNDKVENQIKMPFIDNIHGMTAPKRSSTPTEKMNKTIKEVEQTLTTIRKELVDKHNNNNNNTTILRTNNQSLKKNKKVNSLKSCSNLNGDMSQYDDESIIGMNILYLDDAATLPEMKNKSKIESDTEKKHHESNPNSNQQQQPIKVNIIAKNKTLKTTSKQSNSQYEQSSDNYSVNNSNSLLLETPRRDSVALKRVWFASDSLPTIELNKKGSNKIISTQMGDRVLNDIFVPKRSSLDYCNYNPLMSIKTTPNKKTLESTFSELNLKSNSKYYEKSNNNVVEAAAAAAANKDKKNYTFKEFKLQVLKKKQTKEPNSFVQSSISNIQKRYFNNKVNNNHHHVNKSSEPYSFFISQPISLKDNNNNTSSININNNKKFSLVSASDNQLNKTSFSSKLF